MRWAIVALALLGVAGRPLRAQRPWTDQLYPYLYYSTIDGVWVAAHYARYSPMGILERPEPSFATIRLDGAASTAGSYSLSADAQAPAYFEGWRLGLTLAAARANRLGYYGLGNGAPYDGNLVTPAQPYYYRVSRSTRTARLTVQRRIVGPLRVLAGGSLERTDYRELPGPSLFRSDHAAGVVDSSTVPFSDRVLRAGVVLDLRDHEIDPHRGLFLEVLYASGRDYTRTTAAARVYVHPLERLILAARLAGERMGGGGGAPPVAAQVVMESSEGPYIAVGGYRSLRGYYDARFVGPGKVVGGVEARYGIPWAPGLLELKLVAFYDVGRVFAAGEPVKLTGTGLHASGGGELALRILRNTLVVAGVGAGADGTQLLFGTTWSY